MKLMSHFVLKSLVKTAANSLAAKSSVDSLKYKETPPHAVGKGSENYFVVGSLKYFDE